MGEVQRTSLRQEQKERTYRRLVEAGRTAFEHSGYAAVTVDEIVRLAGTSRGTFYLHFESKADVLRAVLHEVEIDDDYRVMIEGFRAITAPSVEALQVWAEKLIDNYTLNRAIIRAMYEAQATDPAFMRGLVERFDEYGLAWQTLTFVTDADGEDLRTGATMTFALISQTLHLWLNCGLELDRTRVSRYIAEFMHIALRPACGCTCVCCRSHD